MRTELSVLIAGGNCAEMTEESLKAVLEQRLAGDTNGEPLRCEVILAHNGDTNQTRSVCDRLESTWSLSVLNVARPGRGFALNQALDAANGELIVVTDDQIQPSSEWLAELHRAARQYPDAVVFCGPIIPEFPDERPVWLREHPYFSRLVFGGFNPMAYESELPPPRLPYGQNFAIRSSALGVERFRTDLGSTTQNAFICEDIELLRRFRKRKEKFVFVPSASVTHRLTSALVDRSLLCERAFDLGRNVIKLENMLVLYPVDRVISADDRSAREFEMSMLLSFYFGQVSELSSQGAMGQCRVLTAIIHGLDWSGDPRLLPRSAVDWAASNPRYLPPRALRAFSSIEAPQTSTL